MASSESTSKVTSNCAVCSTESKTRCSKCNIVAYCSKEHQTQDWEVHKSKCCPFKLKPHPDLPADIVGPVYVATKDIQKGQLLFRTSPSFIYPRLNISSDTPEFFDGKDQQHSFGTCVACCKALTDSDDRRKCPKCMLPVCNLSCSLNPVHASMECPIIAKSWDSHNFHAQDPDTYSTVINVRCLLTRDKLPTQWEKLMKIPVACQDVLRREDYQEDRQITLHFIQRVLRMKEFDEQTISKVHGIIWRNLRMDDRWKTCSYLDEQACRVPFACLSNVSCSYIHEGQQQSGNIAEGQLEKEFFAVRNIKVGDYLAISILDKNSPHVGGTKTRRAVLHKTMRFLCTCALCKDPTEFGSFLSAIKCQFCNLHGGVGVMLQEDPLDHNSGWKCNACSRKKSMANVWSILINYEKKEFKGYEEFAKKVIAAFNTCIKLNGEDRNTNSGSEKPLAMMKEIEKASNSILTALQEFYRLTIQKTLLASVGPTHSDVMNNMLTYLNGLFFYLSLNRKEPLVPSTVCFAEAAEAIAKKLDPSWEFFVGEPANWIRLNEELCAKALELVQVHLKFSSEYAAPCGMLHFYITFSKLILLKNKALTDKNYDKFLQELQEWKTYKEKAELFANRVRTASEVVEGARKECLRKMEIYVPSEKNSPLDIFTKIIQENMDTE